MTRDLLWRGMLAGILAALLATLFARVHAEPLVDCAIAFETAHEKAEAAMGHTDEEAEPPVSRATQRGIGLATAVVLYGAAIGGIFSLVFAYAYGRIGRMGPRSLALLIAAIGFLVIVVVPGLKYPPNPPAVGRPDTIQMRTATYFAMIAVSLVAIVIAGRVRTMLVRQTGGFDATIAAAGVYVLVVALVQVGLPRIDEVPIDFPASLLWSFRIASIGTQLILWATIGLGFGWLADRRLRRAGGGR